MVLAAVRVQPGAAKDLDQLLAGLNRSTLGHALVWVIAAGFLVFAGYSVLESRYRSRPRRRLSSPSGWPVDDAGS